MAKWTSPILTDIRNKLGKSVIFSNWKGRGYFRKYAIPANPRTNAQKAVREVFKLLVKRFQEISVNESEKAGWDNLATPYQVSGFNLFMSYGRKSEIEVDQTSVSAGSSVNITYKLGFPVDEACIVVIKDGAYKETINLTQAEGTISYTCDTAGTYEFWISEKNVSDPDGHPSRITKWKPDKTNGVAKEAKTTAS